MATAAVKSLAVEAGSISLPSSWPYTGCPSSSATTLMPQDAAAKRGAARCASMRWVSDCAVALPARNHRSNAPPVGTRLRAMGLAARGLSRASALLQGEGGLVAGWLSRASALLQEAVVSLLI